MYETITFDLILQRMLNRVPDSIDKREGSVVFDALAPAAVELQNMYIELDRILNESFADTQTRTYLIKRAAERGLAPYPATSAILKGEFQPNSLDIPIGSRFNLDSLNYIVLKKRSDGVYQLQCEQTGTVGNSQIGEITPIEYIQGLQRAMLTELLIPGEDDEDTELFRQRYFDSLHAQAFGGNITDYKEKVNALPGVGGIKVYPVWNGGGTVKLVIVGSDFKPPTLALIDSVQSAVDPEQNQGKGLGLAPVGHIVTVCGAETLPINISTTLTFDAGYTFDNIKSYAETAIDTYFKSLSEKWAENTQLIVRISQIEMCLLEVAGISDIYDTSLNGNTHNLTLTADQIPVRGKLNG